MNHSRLPDDFEATAHEAETIINILHKDIGISLKDLRETDLQGLYDLVLEHASPEKREAYQRLVIIDRETAEELHRHVLRSLPGFRPDRTDVSAEVEIMARREALFRLPHLAKSASLQAIDEALLASGRNNRIVVEDRDYDRFGVEMNQIISRRPHGRSPAVGEAPTRRSEDVLDEAVIKTFNAALAALMHPRSDRMPLTNTRSVGFTWTKAGTEGKFAKAKVTSDLVILAFEPGRENEGPVNIAVLEEHNGRTFFWPRCSPWCLPDGSSFKVVSNDGARGFLFALSSLAPVQNIPREDFDRGVEMARRVLRQTARKTEVG